MTSFELGLSFFRDSKLFARFTVVLAFLVPAMLGKVVHRATKVS